MCVYYICLCIFIYNIIICKDTLHVHKNIGFKHTKMVKTFISVKCKNERMLVT